MYVPPQRRPPHPEAANGVGGKISLLSKKATLNTSHQGPYALGQVFSVWALLVFGPDGFPW